MCVALAGDIVDSLRRPVVVFEIRLDAIIAQEIGQRQDRLGGAGAANPSAGEIQIRRIAPIRTAARSSSWLRTPSQAPFTAPPVIQICREAADDPASPMSVSAGRTTTASTPSSVRAIWACTATMPWPHSDAAL